MVMIEPPLGRVVRKMSPADKLELARREREEPNVREIAHRMAMDRDLPLKVLGADWQLDGASLVIFYSAPERIDLAELGDALGAQFGTTIEFRKMGAREETKVMGG